MPESGWSRRLAGDFHLLLDSHGVALELGGVDFEFGDANDWHASLLCSAGAAGQRQRHDHARHAEHVPLSMGRSNEMAFTLSLARYDKLLAASAMSLERSVRTLAAG